MTLQTLCGRARRVEEQASDITASQYCSVKNVAVSSGREDYIPV